MYYFKSLPEKWNNTKKLAKNAKQEVSHLQTSEIENIRRRIATFDVQQYNFREEFRKNAPFMYIVENPYKMLDTVSLY